MPFNANVASREVSESGNERLRRALESTRERLLDLTLRNGLLNFHDKGSKVVKIVKELPDHIHEHMVERRQSMALIPKAESIQEKDSFSESSSDAGQTELVVPRGNRSTEALEISSTHIQLPDGMNEAIRKIEIAAAEDAYDKREEESGAEELSQEDEEILGDDAQLYDDFLQTTIDEEQLDGRMRRIQSDYKNILDSTGSNLLFLALGFLEWRDPLKDPNKPRLAPLILIPIHLKRELESVPVEGAQGKRRAKTVHIYRYRLNYTGDDISINLTLALKLKKDFGLHLPEINKSGLDSPETYLLEVEKMLDGWRPPTKDHWKVLRVIRIGFFTFSKDVMYRDLDPENWPKTGLVKIPMVETLLDGRTKDPQTEVSLTEVENCHQAQTIATVMDADSSQMKVLMRVSNGENLVVQGPPGTGKSQTITNMIASALYSGKKVLFMAEKMAALEVVRSRLDKADLGIYCLELHSKSSSVNAVHSQIRARLDRKSRRRTQVSIQEHREQINKFRRRLNKHCEVMGRTVEGLSCDIASLFWKSEQCKVQLKEALIRGGGKPEKVEIPGFRLESTGAANGSGSPNLNDLAAAKNILRVVRKHWEEGIPTRGLVWNGFHADRLIDEQLVHIESILSESIAHLIRISSMQENSLVPSIVNASSELLWNVVEPLISLGAPGNDFDQDAAKEIFFAHVEIEKFIALLSDLKIILDQAQSFAYTLAHNSALSDSSLHLAVPAIESLLKRPDQGGKTLEGLEYLIANYKDAESRLERGKALVNEVFSEFGIGNVPRSPREVSEYLPWFESCLNTEDNIALAASELPFSQNIRRYFEQAQHQSRALTENRKRLETYFVIEDSPDPKMVGEIRRDLREYRNTLNRAGISGGILS